MICFNEGEGHYYAELFPDLAQIEETIAAIKNGLMAEGSHQLHERLAVNVFSYDTASEDLRGWEAHENHLDVHVILSGEEIVGFVDSTDFMREEVDLLNDSYGFQGEATNHWHLNPQQWLVIYPKEGHKTGISIKKSVTVKKAVFKIKIK